MMTKELVPINSANLSSAWLRVFDLVMAPGRCSPIVVSLFGFKGPLPEEDPSIREALDAALAQHGKVCVEDNAFTIFPYRTWLRYQTREQLFNRYRRMYPRLVARDKQGYGTYFKRLIDSDGISSIGKVKVVHQLDHILDVWARGRNNNKRPRFSALQASIFDPAKDHTGQPVRGFPCLQQVGFSYDDEGGLAVSAFYPTQYVFDRAYGNYLGLCHLGLFMAHEMGLRFARLDVFVAAPMLGDVAKRSLLQLASPRNVRAMTKDELTV